MKSTGVSFHSASYQQRRGKNKFPLLLDPKRCTSRKNLYIAKRVVGRGVGNTLGIESMRDFVGGEIEGVNNNTPFSLK